MTFVHTNQQISDKWTTGSFTRDKRDEPMILLCVVSESFITAATFPLSKLFSSCSSDGGKKPSVYWPSLEVHRQARRPSQSLWATRWLHCDMIRTHHSTWLMEETQSDVKGQENPSQASGDRLHFTGVEASGDWSHEVPPGIGRPIAFLRVHQEFLSRGLWKIIIIG